MKRPCKLLTMLVTMAAVLALMMSSVFAAEWAENNTITVEGSGVALDTARTPAQGRMLARRAAIVDAQRQVLEAILGVNVTAETTVNNMMVQSDVVKTKVAGMVRGAKIVDERYGSDGTYYVKLQVPVFGEGSSIASAVIPQYDRVEPLPAPVPSVAPSIAPAAPSVPASAPSSAPVTKGSSAAPAMAGKAVGGYTGLIVDCSGMGLKPVMSPVIKNDMGDPIYGYKNLNYKAVISRGMAGYAYDTTGATRAGSNPLVVRAVRLDGANPVLSTADANMVLIENGASHFLDNANVVFIR